MCVRSTTECLIYLWCYSKEYFVIDFDVDWSVSPLSTMAKSAPTYRARTGSADRDRETTSGMVARTESPWHRAASPSADHWNPLSVDIYSTEVIANVQPDIGPASSSTAGRDSPRPLVFDIELGRPVPEEDDDDDRPLQRLTTMPRPDTPSNVWSVVETCSVL